MHDAIFKIGLKLKIKVSIALMETK